MVQELADEYGWWELAHTDSNDLSEEVLSFCRTKHPQWGTLINFLEASCKSEETTTEISIDPISGQLIQGIATVAEALEKYHLSPQVLQDDREREEVLKNYDLPKTFFLRSWDALIQVLTPKERNDAGRSITSRRHRSLKLELDFESLNTQLVLPQQTLWQSKWRDLRGLYCQIPEAQWENLMPTEGALEVPELAIALNTVQDAWMWQLLDHNRISLFQWQTSGIDPQFPCLFFDAETGERILLPTERLIIDNTSAILCFAPKDWQLELSDGIEILDRHIPTSIRDWHGHELELVTPISTITLKNPAQETAGTIHWSIATNQPALRGLRLKGKKPVYLQAPVFWYPPTSEQTTLNVLVENLVERDVIARTVTTISAGSAWSPIALASWITKPDLYEARFWTEAGRWSYKFEVSSPYQIDATSQLPSIAIKTANSHHSDQFPFLLANAEDFWTFEAIDIQNLWTLETLTLRFSNGQNEIAYPIQADREGKLQIRTSTLHGLLPDSNYYRLSYQRLGSEPQRLIEVGVEPELVWIWTEQGIEISGLVEQRPYHLECWNLLLPQHDSVKLLVAGDRTCQITLDLPPGMYHLALHGSCQKVQSIGWWCNSDRSSLPDEAFQDESLENYCYTILDNESAQDFVMAANRLQLDLTLERLETMLVDLQASFRFPEWLDQAGLLQKLQGLSQHIQQQILSPKNTENSTSSNLTQVTSANSELPRRSSPALPSRKDSSLENQMSTGRWHLVSVANWGRDAFCNQLEAVLASQNSTQTGVASFEKCVGSVYSNFVLVNVTNLGQARITLRRIPYFQKLESRPLRDNEIHKMLR